VTLCSSEIGFCQERYKYTPFDASSFCDVWIAPSGLFDNCLKEQPELGSDMISNAQLQYQAIVALHDKKVVYNTW